MKNIIALLLLALLWVLFWIFMQNGKYVALDEGGFTLLDTRTGTVYRHLGEQYRVKFCGSSDYFCKRDKLFTR